MAVIDGISININNIFGYQILSSAKGKATIRGTIRYKNSNMFLSYSFDNMLDQGLNLLNKDFISPSWQFSSPALKELFFTYNILPSGTYEYCVNVTVANNAVETSDGRFEECLYHRANDFFLINLIDPSDKTTLKEYNPVLAWVANYSLSNELTYRIRIAEIKQGQNPVNAVMSNQPIYDENNLMQNAVVYPIYAKPLVANQPYAWTVDAYYKEILLGGAEAWQFIILDSVVASPNSDLSYVDIKRESGVVKLTAIGNLKLKYLSDEVQKDSLFLEVFNENDKKKSFSPNKLAAKYGDNRYTIDFAQTANLKHKGMYTLKIRTKTRHEYKLFFQYLNPSFAN
jgi:hypothetical protein